MQKKLLLKLIVTTMITVTGILGANQVKVSAAPIKDAQITLTQPDGQSIDCYASGDEFYNYIHDSKGRAIVKDEKTKYYVFGKYVKNKVIPSRERVTKDKVETLKNVNNDSRVNMSEVKEPIEEIEKQRELLGANQAVQSTTKNIGTLNNIVVFIKFSDQNEITRGISSYERQFNSQNQASLASYYKEASYGQLDVNTTFYPKPQGERVLSYTDNHPRSYYSNVPQSERGMKEQTLLANAINAVKSQIPKDLNIDSDNDGKIDNVCFIIKGGSDEWSSLLWPHKWGMYYQHPEINGKKVDTYNFQLEDFIGDNGIAVLSHEMFHTLGAPDLYHYDSNNKITSVGPWDIMDNCYPTPQVSSYMKMYYGKWMNNISEINKPGKYSIKSINNSTNNSYIIKSPNSASEYFVVEYRKREGLYESKLSGEGLLVYRINTAYKGQGNANSKSSSQDEIYLYRPSGSLYSNGYINNAALGSNRTSISSSELFLSNGTNSGISLENINISAGTANFDVVINGQRGNGETGTEKPNEGSAFTFDFKGYSDKQFAKLDLDLKILTSKLTVKNIKTHYYFNDSYASILIQDEKGQTIFDKDFIGNEVNDALIKDIPIKEGYYLTVKHREFKGRLFITNENNKLSLDTNSVNSYKISKNELKSVDPGSIPKPSENPYIGSNFTFNFKGYSDKQFGELDLDLGNLTSKLVVENIKTHYYFNDSYASILIQDEKGQTVFDKNFIGNEVNDALTKDIPIKEGYYLTVKHREFKGRLFITNENNKLSLDTNSVNSYKISKNELKSVDPGTIPKLNNAYIGKNFKFTFKGAEEWLFAELNLDLSSHQAKIDIKNGDAHYLITDSYSSILIRDAEGNTVYTKDFIGNKVNQASVQNISIKPGYYITIKHKEPNINNRLLITNTDNKLELDKDKSITYKINDTGLVKSSENEIKKLPLKYEVNFDDTKAVTGDLEITGDCVSGDKITNLAIYLNGVKSIDATRSILNDSQNKYKGYNLSQAAFKFNLPCSRWSENSYPYKIVATLEDGKTTTLKEGNLIIKR